MIQPTATSWRWLALGAMLTASGPATGPPPAGMARLAGGTFTMGTDPALIDGLCRRFGTSHRDLFLAEVPSHAVTLPPFLIDRTAIPLPEPVPTSASAAPGRTELTSAAPRV